MLRTIDWLIMLLYFVFVLGIGFALKRFMKTSKDFFLRPGARSPPGLRTGLYLRQPGCPGSDRHGRVGREIRHRDQPFLLDWRYSGDDVRRRLHDAFLLRFEGALSAGVSATALTTIRRVFSMPCTFAVMTVFSSGISMYAMARLIQTLHVFDAPVPSLRPADWLDLPFRDRYFGDHRSGLYLSGRTDQRHLQRGAAVFPDRCRISAAGLGWACATWADGAD